MAKAPRFNTAFRNALLDGGMLTDFDGGTLKIYTTPRPATADTAASGTLLATIDVDADSFAAAASGGVLAKNGTWEEASTPAPGGTAVWFRLANAGDTIRIDGTVGTSDADLILSAVVLATGDKVVVDTFNVTVKADPAA